MYPLSYLWNLWNIWPILSTNNGVPADVNNDKTVVTVASEDIPENMKEKRNSEVIGGNEEIVNTDKDALIDHAENVCRIY